MNETLWGTRKPLDRAMNVHDEDGVVVLGDFYGADAFQIPEDTPPLPDGRDLAGARVRVSRRFLSIDPTGRLDGESFTHLWCREGYGVVELPGGFVLYETSSWPEHFAVSHDESVPAEEA
jgi:hypothetical protein